VLCRVLPFDLVGELLCLAGQCPRELDCGAGGFPVSGETVTEESPASMTRIGVLSS
jgi:hypothetical protein